MGEAKDKLLSYLNNLQNKDSSMNFSAHTASTFLSTSFGIMVHYLLGENNRLDNKLLEEYYGIENTNSANIIDPSFNANDLIGIHKSDYVINQINYFSLVALDVIGIRFKNVPTVMTYLDNPGQLEAWFNSLNLSTFWYESNNIMFILYYFFYTVQHGSDNQALKAKESISIIMGLLNRTQDSQTGYWGTNLNNRNLLDGCFGAAHIYLFYDYLGHEIPYIKKIVDSTLSLHNKNGLLGSRYGGACEDYDAIEIYLRCLNQTDYRKNEIANKLVQMHEIISSSQNRDGGFSYRISESKLRRNIYSYIIKKEYLYSGWGKMKTNSFRSDIWATWFRILSLTVIEKIIENKGDFCSYSLPAWGYIN